MDSVRKYFKKYRFYFIGEVASVMGWLGYFFFFNQFYQEIVFYVDKGAKYIVQLIFITNYYTNELLMFLFVGFLLMTLNALLILLFFIRNRQEGSKQKAMTYSLAVFSLLFTICQVFLLTTMIWPLFLMLLIFSLTIIFIIFVITKYSYEEKHEKKQMTYKINEVIKTAGPFLSQNEVEQYSDEFFKYWQEHFDEQNLDLVSHVRQDEGNYYLVDFIIQSKENLL